MGANGMVTGRWIGHDGWIIRLWPSTDAGEAHSLALHICTSRSTPCLQGCPSYEEPVFFVLTGDFAQKKSYFPRDSTRKKITFPHFPRFHSDFYPHFLSIQTLFHSIQIFDSAEIFPSGKDNLLRTPNWKQFHGINQIWNPHCKLVNFREWLPKKYMLATPLSIPQ